MVILRDLSAVSYEKMIRAGIRKGKKQGTKVFQPIFYKTSSSRVWFPFFSDNLNHVSDMDVSFRLSPIFVLLLLLVLPSPPVLLLLANIAADDANKVDTEKKKVEASRKHDKVEIKETEVWQCECLQDRKGGLVRGFISKVPEVRRYERSRDRNSRMLRSYVGKYLRRGIGAYLVDFEDALLANIICEDDSCMPRFVSSDSCHAKH